MLAAPQRAPGARARGWGDPGADMSGLKRTGYLNRLLVHMPALDHGGGASVDSISNGVCLGFTVGDDPGLDRVRLARERTSSLPVGRSQKCQDQTQSTFVLAIGRRAVTSPA
jgi:hypothetical protein